MMRNIILAVWLVGAVCARGAVISVTPADDFDGVMKGAPPNTVIHLAPGTYFTAGNIDGTSRDSTNMWTVKSGWFLKGAGIFQTRIVLTNANVPEVKYHVMAADGNAVNDVTISDLTLDGNGSRFDQSNNRSGIILRGSRNTLRNLRVVGWGSKSVLTECFGIGLFAHGTNAWHNLIEGCQVTEPTPKSVGTGFTGICQSTTSAQWQSKFPTVRHCWVDNTGGHAAVYSHGYTFYAANGGVLENSTAYDVVTGVNWDSFGLEAAVIRGNQFHKVKRGVFLNATTPEATVRELNIHDNWVRLEPSITSAATVGIEVNGFALGKGMPMGSVVIRDNHVTMDGGAALSLNSRLAIVRGATNAVIAGNFADFATGHIAIQGRYNMHAVVTNNITLAGAPLGYLAEPEVVPPVVEPVVPPVTPPVIPPVTPPVTPPVIPPVIPPQSSIPKGVFVSPTGSSGNAGTAASPTSLVSALNAASPQIKFAPARRVILRGGVYSLGATISPSLVGTATSPWIIAPYPGESVTLNINTGARHGLLYSAAGAAFQEWRDIRFTDLSTGQGVSQNYHLVKLDRGESIGFVHCIFDNSKRSGILANGPAANTYLYGCLILNNGSDTQFDHGLYLKSKAGKFTVENCLMVGNSGHSFHAYNGSSTMTEGVRGFRVISNSIFTYGEPQDRFILFQDSGPAKAAIDCWAISNLCFNAFPGVDSTDRDRSSIKIVNGANSRIEDNMVWGGDFVMLGGNPTVLRNKISRDAPWAGGLQSWVRPSTRNTNILHVTTFNPDRADNAGVDLTGLLADGPYEIRAASSPQRVCARGVYAGGFVSFPMTNLVYEAQTRAGGFHWKGDSRANGFIVIKL